MNEITLSLLLLVAIVILSAILIRWWRHRRAAKLADDLLAEVMKEKDAFRR